MVKRNGTTVRTSLQEPNIGLAWVAVESINIKSLNTDTNEQATEPTAETCLILDPDKGLLKAALSQFVRCTLHSTKVYFCRLVKAAIFSIALDGVSLYTVDIG